MKKTAEAVSVERTSDGMIKIEQADMGNDSAVVVISVDQVDQLVQWLKDAKGGGGRSDADIMEVYQCREWQNANAHLLLGWKLLTTHTWDFGDPGHRNQKTVYVLGWPSGAGPKTVHPEQVVPESSIR
jgi:hypothetical protein